MNLSIEANKAWQEILTDGYALLIRKPEKLSEAAQIAKEVLALQKKNYRPLEVCYCGNNERELILIINLELMEVIHLTHDEDAVYRDDAFDEGYSYTAENLLGVYYIRRRVAQSV